MGVAHLLGGGRGSQWLTAVRPTLVKRFSAQISLPADIPTAVHLPMLLEHGEDMWRIRSNLVQQCVDRRLHLPLAVAQLSKEQFLQQYRHETRAADATPDIWQVLHLYARKDAPAEGEVWSMPPPPPLAYSRPEIEGDDADAEEGEGEEEDEGEGEAEEEEEAEEEKEVTTSTKGSHIYALDIGAEEQNAIQRHLQDQAEREEQREQRRASLLPGVLIVCFKTTKVPLSAVASLQTYMQFHGMTWVDMYFVTKPGKTLREEISRRFAGVRVQQFVLDQRRHLAITRGCLSPATVMPLTPEQRSDMLRSKELKASQFPGTKTVSSQVDKSDPSDAYFGHQNSQIVHLGSRYGSETYYRCVGNRK